MTLNQLVERLKQIQEELECKDAEIFLEFPRDAINAGVNILSITHDGEFSSRTRNTPYIYMEIGY